MALLNKTFYKFTFGFMMIVAFSFVAAAVLSHLDERQLSAKAEQMQNAAGE